MCAGYDTKKSDGDVRVMLWGIRSILSFSSLASPLWPGEVAPDRDQSIGQIDSALMLNWIGWYKTVLIC